MTKKEILDYIIETPGNTNRAVLDGMLDSFGGGSGGSRGGDPGYECKTEMVTLLEENVTTELSGEGCADGQMEYAGLIDADNINVTFNGVSYSCSATKTGNDYKYGAPIIGGTDGFDFSVFPFSIYSGGLGNTLITESAGTYTIKIEALSEVVETTPCFEKAVNSVIGGGSEVDMIKSVLTDDPSIVRLNKTVDELLTFLNSGKSPFVYADIDDYGATRFRISGLVKYINFNERNVTYTIHVLDPEPDGSAIDFVGHSRDDYPTATIS